MLKPKPVKILKRVSQAIESEWITGASLARLTSTKPHHAPLIAVMNGIRARLFPGSQVIQFSRLDTLRAVENGIIIADLSKILGLKD